MQGRTHIAERHIISIQALYRFGSATQRVLTFLNPGSLSVCIFERRSSINIATPVAAELDRIARGSGDRVEEAAAETAVGRAAAVGSYGFRGHGGGGTGNEAWHVACCYASEG